MILRDVRRVARKWEMLSLCFHVSDVTSRTHFSGCKHGTLNQCCFNVGQVLMMGDNNLIFQDHTGNQYRI